VAVRDLELEDYAPQFAARRIVAGVRDEAEKDEATPLFKRILGNAWQHLPEPIRALHAGKGRHSWQGAASVERGHGVLARLASALMRFPRAAASVPLRVEISPRKRGMQWRRRFGGHAFRSTLAPGRGRWERLLVERFGPMAFGIALVPVSAKLRYVVRCWSAFGIPLPSGWAPGGAMHEFVDAGRFGFDVEIRHRLTGLIVRYKGWLVPETPT